MSKIGTHYDFKIVTKDKKVVHDYELGIGLSPMLFNFTDTYSNMNPEDIDWTGEKTEVLGVAEEKVQKYIAELKKSINKDTSSEVSEGFKKELEILENNAVAVVVIKSPCQAHHR